MIVTYSIGENKPWRLTRDSAFALMRGVCESGGAITGFVTGTACPPTYCLVRVQVDSTKADKFLAFMGGAAEVAEICGGQAE